MKVCFYLGKEDQYLADILKERVEEEDAGMSETCKHLILVGLGASDPRTDVAKREEHPDTFKVSFRATMPLLLAIDTEMRKRKMKQASCIRALLHEALKVPLPEKVKRAPRDPALSSAIIMESQAESFMDMRNLRSSPKEPEALPLWERIREGPKEMFLVNLCRVKGCPNNDLGLHKHPGNQLAGYADAVEAGGRT